MERTIRWIDRIWLGLLLILIFFSPLLMFRGNGQGILKEIAPDLNTLPHYVPILTNLVFKEIFCQSIILILLYLTLVKKALTGNWKFTRSSIDIPIFALLFTSGISLSYSHTPTISYRDWGLLASFVLFYYLILDQLRDIKKIRLVLWAVVASAIVTAFFATCQHLQIYLWGFLSKAEDRNRMSAMIGHNNGVASYLMMASFVLIALRFGMKNLKENITDKIINNIIFIFIFLMISFFIVMMHTSFREVWLVSWVIIFIGIITKKIINNFIFIFLLFWFLFVIMATLSRGVWLGTFIGGLILLIYLSKNLGIKQLFRKHWIKFAIGVIILGIFISVLSIPSRLNPLGVSIIQRFKDTFLRKETYLKDDRIRMWASSMEMIREHPWKGVGFGTFKYWIPLYQGEYFARHPDSKLEPTYKLTNESHNEYIQTWAELGIAGFLIGLWLAFKYLIEGIKLKNIFSSNSTLLNPIFYVSLFCATVGVLCQALVDFPLHVAPLALLFILLGGLVINREKLSLSVSQTQLTRLSARAIFWLVGLVIATAVTLYPQYIDIKADWYKNRMDYFLQAGEDFGANKMMALRQKALWKAMEYGNKAITFDPHNARAHYEMGLGYIKLNQITEAITHLERALRDMQYADLHFNLADSYEWLRRDYASQGDIQKENEALENAIKHYHLAAFIYPLNKKLAVEAHQNHQFYLPSEAMHREGVLLYQQGKNDQAISTWRKIAQKDPYYLKDKYYGLSRQYWEGGDFKTAIQILQQAYTLDSTNEDTLKQLGATYYLAGDYKEALSCLDKLYKTYPTNTKFMLGYARIYEKLNQKQLALEWARKTLAINSTHQEALEIIRRLQKK